MKRTCGLITRLAMLCIATAAGTAIASPIYIDASTTNSAFAPSAGGGALTTTAGDTVDGMWRLRTSLGIDPSATTIPTGTITLTSANNVFESTGNSNPSDNVPRVVTTVTGLPSNTYNVSVLFWGDQNSSPWRIRAGLSDTLDPLQLFIVNGSDSTFAAVDTSNRRLYVAALGQVTGTSISVFVEDAPATSGNERTWYDGIAYEAVPEPTSFAISALCASLALALRRRSR